MTPITPAQEAVRWCEEEGNADKATLGNAHLKLALFADEQLKLQDQYFNSTGTCHVQTLFFQARKC